MPWEIKRRDSSRSHEDHEDHEEGKKSSGRIKRKIHDLMPSSLLLFSVFSVFSVVQSFFSTPILRQHGSSRNRPQDFLSFFVIFVSSW
jgi:hypothetical protein